MRTYNYKAVTWFLRRRRLPTNERTQAPKTCFFQKNQLVWPRYIGVAVAELTRISEKFEFDETNVEPLVGLRARC